MVSSKHSGVQIRVPKIYRTGIWRVKKPRRNEIIMSLLRQNDVATSFGRNNDIITTSYAHWLHIFYFLFCQEVLRVSQAVLLFHAILYLKGELALSTKEKWLLVAGMVIILYLCACLWNYFFNICEQIAMNMRTALTALLYKKVSNAAQGSMTEILQTILLNSLFNDSFWFFN